MPDNASSEQFDQVLLDHAVRCWDAERENSARLSSRGNLLLSALAALFGLGLFRIDWFRSQNDLSRVPRGIPVLIIKALLGAALMLFGLSFLKIMGRRGKRDPKGKAHSSDLLGLPASIMREGPPVGDDARQLVFIRVYRAFTDLQAGNALRKTALDNGQQLFLAGLALVATAILMYLFFSDPHSI